MARVFHRYGAKVILVSRNIDKLNRLKQELIEMYPEGFPPFPVRLDLEKLDEIHRITEGIVQIHGKVDILINNAGLGYRGTIMDTQLAVYQKLMTVNLFGQIELTKSMFPKIIGILFHIHSSCILYFLSFSSYASFRCQEGRIHRRYWQRSISNIYTLPIGLCRIKTCFLGLPRLSSSRSICL